MFASKLRLAMLLVLPLVAIAAPGMFVSAQGQSRIFLPLIMAPPPPPETVFVRSSQRVENEYCHPCIVGEVINTRSTPVGTIVVTAHFYDAKNQLLGTVEASSSLSVLYPGEVAPFSIAADTADWSATADIRRYELTLQVSSRVGTVVRLTVVSSQMTYDPTNGTEVRGTVRNDTSTTVEYGRVVATFYDASGNIAALSGNNSDPATLESGQVGQFFLTARWREGTGPFRIVAEADPIR